MEKEKWKDIKGYSGLYRISSLGRIRSYSKQFKLFHGGKVKTKGRLLKCFNRGGYLIIVLRKDNKRKTHSKSRLVGKTFVSNPFNKPEINHKNGIKTDDRAANIEWSTKSENIRHAYKVLKRKPSNYLKENNRPKPVKQIDPKLNELMARFTSINQASNVTRISRHHIGRCVNGKRKLAGGYLWIAN